LRLGAEENKHNGRDDCGCAKNPDSRDHEIFGGLGILQVVERPGLESFEILREAPWHRLQSSFNAMSTNLWYAEGIAT